MTPARLTPLIALVSALLAARAGAEPTGAAVVDPVLAGLFGAVVCLASSRARRWSWLWASAMATVLATETVPLVLAALAALGGLSAVALKLRHRDLGAVVGALVAQSLLRLPTDTDFALPTLVAIVAVTPLLVSGVLHARRTHRRWAMRFAVAALGVVIAGVAGLGALALTSRGDATRAVAQAQRAIDSLGDAEADEARFTLAASADLFRALEERADAWWMAPARVVPIVAQQRTALAELAASGAELAETVANATAVADIEAVRGSAGRIDVEAIAALGEPADRSLAALEDALRTTAEVDSGWLVDPLARRIDRYREVLDEAIGPARLTQEGVRVVPDLLGRSGPRTYLVLFANPAESRDGGGFVGAVGLLHANGGQLSFDGVEGSGGIEAALHAAQLAPPEGLPASFLAQRPELFAQNWTGDPDLPTVGAAVQALWPQIRPEPIDGVLYTDPHGLAGLLQLTGPVSVPDLDEALGPDAVADYLMVEQYRRFEGDETQEEAERDDILADLGDVAFRALTAGDLPGPRGLADLLRPAVRGRHLLLWTFDDAPHRLLADLGLDGRLAIPPGQDLLHVTAANNRANKLDPYVARAIDHDVVIVDDELHATTTVTLTSNVIVGELNDYITGTGNTPDGLAEGTHRINLTVHTPWALTGVSIDGADTAAAPGQATEAVGGLYRHTVNVAVPEGGTTTVVFRLAGPVDPDAPYELAVVPFAGPAPDRLSVRTEWRGEPGAVIAPTEHVEALRVRNG